MAPSVCISLPTASRRTSLLQLLPDATIAALVAAPLALLPSSSDSASCTSCSCARCCCRAFSAMLLASTAFHRCFDFAICSQ